MLRTYDPKSVSIIVGGNIMTGLADGTFLTVERDEDAFALNIGSDGEGVRSKSNNFSGTFTLTIQQGSPSNDVLSAFAQADELSGSGVVSVLVKDNNGNSLHVAETAWVQKAADAEYARESGDREWVIRTDKLTTFVGGNDVSTA